MFGFFNKVTDPVCKMGVDKNQTKYSSQYKDKKVYFCSEDCQKQFSANPKNYIKANSQASCCH